MRVLLVNALDTYGGAAIASYRLMQGLLRRGIEVRMLVGDKRSQDPRVQKTRRFARTEYLLARIVERLGLNMMEHISSFQIDRHPWFRAADVVNYHNLHSGYFNYLALSRLTRAKPSVLTLHDMWTFTGHCAYSRDCERWKTGCGRCPHLDYYPSMRHDFSRLEWKLKHRTYRKSRFHVITLSRWLDDITRKGMLSPFPIHLIPNGIELSVFRQRDREAARKVLGIPTPKVILSGAQLLTDERKGGADLPQALQALPEELRRRTTLLLLGGNAEGLDSKFGMKVLPLGYVEGDDLKAVVYSAADLFLFPTKADNLPLMVQEALCCGTPSVSFRVGGVPDLIRHEETGLLASPGDAHELAALAQRLLEDDALSSRMSRRCREVAESEYSIEMQVDRYVDLFSTAIAERKSA